MENAERRVYLATAYDAVRRNLGLSHEAAVRRLRDEGNNDREALAILESLRDPSEPDPAKTRVEVWQVRGEHFRAAICGEAVPFSPDHYQHVATLEAFCGPYDGQQDERDADDAYQLTNSIDDAWWKRLMAGRWVVRCLVQSRSTSVGDIVVVDGRALRCAGIGWTPLAAKTEEGR